VDRAVKYVSGFVVGISALFFLSSLTQAAERKPVEVKKSDKCQVCGMLVAGYPNWISQIIFTDGTYAFFDGPKDMFRYYFNIAKYNPSKKQTDIDMIYVTEYYSAKLADARKLFFVLGSDVDGPMGVELVPIESKEKAKEFMKDHRGKKILKFDEVRKEDLR
jgi:nitrous oxide reductase accessory protein NosL